ncbi:MAG: SEC-C domain-containing protein [Actinobacteria bacterium]|nr:SEC-C domain-containing protein [Actinomycetota bacterium]
MSKKSSTRKSSGPATTVEDADVPVVGMREACPCGSGRRYKACHGKAASAVFTGPARPFEGIASECDLVALREIVPAATAPLVLVGEHAGRDVLLVTVLPMAWPAIVRADGQVLLALQTNVGSGDASRDVADALLFALAAEPGEPVAVGRVTSDSPRLQDLIDPAVPLEITVHDTFDFWIDGAADLSDDVRASIERASAYAHPTVKLSSVPSAYWTQIGEKEHLRWIMPHDEEPLLDALARLHATGEDSLGEGTRFVGMFRSQGLVCPVWDLPLGMGAEAVEGAAAAFGERLDAALADGSPLSSAQRRARAGLTTRQVTLR